MIGKRKLYLYIGSALATFTAATLGWLVLDKMTAAEWNTLMMWQQPVLFGLFVGGNAIEHIRGKAE